MRTVQAELELSRFKSQEWGYGRSKRLMPSTKGIHGFPTKSQITHSPFGRFLLTSHQSHITMTISSRVHSSLFTSAELIRLPPTVLQHYEERQMIHGKHQVPVRRVNLWSREEHERFLQGLELYPQGPWKLIAAMVGTKTTRQTMTHAQKYRQKINRRQKMQSVMLRTQPLEDNEMDALPSLETVVKEMIELMPLPEPDMLPRLLPVSVAPVELPKLAIGDDNIASSAPMHDIRSPQEVNQVLDFPLFDTELDELLSGLEPLPVVW